MLELNGWDLETKTGGDKKKNAFTKFPEGITRIRLIDSTPFMRWAHWMPQFSRKITCPGYGCPIDALTKSQKAMGTSVTYQNSRNFSLNIFNVDTKEREILEQGVTFFDVLKVAISDILEENKENDTNNNPMDATFKVRKRMLQGKASWTITVEEFRTDTEEEAKAKTEAVDLAEMFKAPTAEQVQSLLEVSSSLDKDERLKEYLDIMGFVKKEETPNELEGDLGIELQED